MTIDRTELITLRLSHIDQRLDWIATTEGRGVLFGTYGSNGEFDPERQRLIEESGTLLDRLDRS